MELDQYMIWMIVIFSIGYLFIVFEHILDVNKATSALMMGVMLWALQFANQQVSKTDNIAHLSEHLSAASQVIVFLLGALIIVELINAHKGFKIFTDYIKIQSKRKALWAIGFLTFFLSAILDNLTTTIVMISIIQKIIVDPDDRLLIGGGVVVAANAGGVWTPIGDVTTTMLWIGERISTIKMITSLFLPSLVCLIVSLTLLSVLLKGNLQQPKHNSQDTQTEPSGIFVLLLGVGVLVFVPIFKQLTGLPPFMGIIFGLSTLWLFTDVVHRRNSDRDNLRVTGVLSKVDISGPLFFLGILLAINALETGGVLSRLAIAINENISNITTIATLIGLGSAVVDNIPLVAASMGMYDISLYPTDSNFWQLIAYCAGTGGSILIIGSAAGVVFMGMEKVSFFSYSKKISIPALAGYLAGIGAYWALQMV